MKCSKTEETPAHEDKQSDSMTAIIGGAAGAVVLVIVIAVVVVCVVLRRRPDKDFDDPYLTPVPGGQETGMGNMAQTPSVGYASYSSKSDGSNEACNENFENDHMNEPARYTPV